MSGLQNIRAKLNELTNKQRFIAEYILSTPEEVSYISLKELSRRTNASEVSVLRLCKALGYENFIALKEALRVYMLGTLQSFAPPSFLEISGERAVGTPAEKLQSICADDMRNLNDMISALNADKLFACARGLLKADEVLVFAHDATKIFADYLSYRLNFLRIKASSVKLGDSDTVQTVLARLRKADYVILLSFPPYHLPIYNVASFCRHRGTPILAITDSPDSPAAADDDVNVFICRTNARYFYNSQVATASFINILTSCIAAEMGGRFEDILAEEQDVSDFMSSGANGDGGK
jgi:DNA-binding MurR/RpiR family transcriptional regulator